MRTCLRVSCLLGSLAFGAVSIGGCAHGKSEESADQPRKHAASHHTAPPANPAPVAAPANSTSIQAEQVAAEEQASYVEEVKFAEGSFELKAEPQRRLAKLVQKARRLGTIQDFKVIAWADEEYPSVHTKVLSDDQRKLAEERSQGLKTFLHGLDQNASVHTYNMAERPNALGELVGTSNSRIKTSLEVAGIPNTDSNVKSPAKAARAIVLVVVKS